MNLDNLDMIKRADREDALGVIGSSAEQLNFQPVIEQGNKSKHTIRNIDYNLSVPFEVTRTYQVPAYVDEHSLVICVSVSGNTEETLSSLHDAISKKAQVVVIATGGKLLDAAKEEGITYVQIDKISQPRYGVPMHLRAITYLLNYYGIISEQAFNELGKAYNTVSSFARTLLADIPTVHLPAHY